MPGCEQFLYATPFGLFLDIIGVVLVIRYGHALFIRTGATPPRPDEGKDGDLYIKHSGPDEGDHARRSFWAQVGVVLLVVGFVLQIIGSIAAILVVG